MKFTDALILCLVLGFSGWLALDTPLGPKIKAHFMPPIEVQSLSKMEGVLEDYFLEDAYLDRLVDRWYEALSPVARAGQLIMPAWDESLTAVDLKRLIETQTVGGFMILNQDFTPEMITELKTANPNKVPLLVSVDAEPSLLKYRFTDPVFTGETVDLETPINITETTVAMAEDLKAYGINLNFAPVYDLGLNKTVIGSRAFSEDPAVVIKRANQMTNEFMQANIIPTAKHFPGHGLVAGDTHLEAQTITTQLTELEQFRAAIKANVPVIMVGHLNVDNQNYDTLGLPATLSNLMMENVLRKQLGFKGVIVTDAMNMQALSEFEDVDINALFAGADIVLMPEDAGLLNAKIVEQMEISPVLAAQFEAKIKRVLRLKLVQRLSKYE